MKIYGLKNCDTCRKAQKWLEEQGRRERILDLREEPPSADDLQRWVQKADLKRLVNTRSTTWRGLDEVARKKALDATTAAAVLKEHPTLIKRPLFDFGDEVMLGFDKTVQDRLRG